MGLIFKIVCLFPCGFCCFWMIWISWASPILLLLHEMNIMSFSCEIIWFWFFFFLLWRSLRPHWKFLEATLFSPMVCWIPGVVAGDFLFWRFDSLFCQRFMIWVLMDADDICCSVLQNISETVVALVTEEGNALIIFHSEQLATSLLC